ncbi:hypothetical protein RQP46_006179 [Phenoliferia psychrophenolica]
MAIPTDAEERTDVGSSSVHIKPFDDSSDAPLSLAQQSAEVDQDPDALIEELEADLDDEFDLGGFRERRMEEMRAQVEKAQKMKQSNYGRYTEMKVEKDVIDATAKAKRSVLHFFHRDFRRCKIMDAHLEKLAAKHFDTLFICAEVSNVPFLVNKIEVQVLPCVVGFVGGVSKMKIVGFEELEGGDSFSTASLELGLIQCGVIQKTPGASGSRIKLPSAASARSGERRGIRNGRGGGNGSESDDQSDG